MRERADSQQADLVFLDAALLELPERVGLIDALPIPIVLLLAEATVTRIETLGRPDVFGSVHGPITQDKLDCALAIACEHFRRHRQLSDQADHLREKIAERKAVERAKGLLMQELRIDADAALRLLKGRARRDRRRMLDVAQQAWEHRTAPQFSGANTAPPDSQDRVAKNKPAPGQKSSPARASGGTVVT